MAFLYTDLLEKLLARENLLPAEARWLMSETMGGNLTSAQISAWLIALRSKGESSVEVGSFAEVMRENSIKVTGIREPVLDTCGTGGDKSNLINVSTMSAIVLANCGVRVAKHGNRSVSSHSGSADILEKMGYPLNSSPEDVVNRINNKNFGFFFAPSFHPAMKFAAPVRKEIGVRTIFNILGPLANPAGAEIHMLGVFNKNYLKLMAEALVQLGGKTILVVHSRDGLDEISPVDKTDYVLFHKGQYHEGIIDPSRLNLSVKNLSEVTVKNGDEAYRRCLAVLDGKDVAGAEIVALNSAAAFFLWDLHHEKTSDNLMEYLSGKTPELREKILSSSCSSKNVI